MPDDIDDDYLAQMESEQRAKGRREMALEADRQATEPLLDCEAMQAAAATMLKIIGREAVVPTEAADAEAAVDEPFEA